MDGCGIVSNLPVLVRQQIGILYYSITNGGDNRAVRQLPDDICVLFSGDMTLG